MSENLSNVVDNKKELERNELHKTIWDIANSLRGTGVDGWDFKSYVLGTMFYRYISEHETKIINKELQQEDPTFDFANLNDDDIGEDEKNFIIETFGFYLPPSMLFQNVVKNAEHNDELNITLNNIFKQINESAQKTQFEGNLVGLFSDFDLNSNRLGATTFEKNEKLKKLLKGINSMQLGDYETRSIDTFGDAYEFLMGMYASQAGKSGGEYFTPQEVSELLMRIVLLGKKSIGKIYDPTCGSGSLLLQAIKVLGDASLIGEIKGQEVVNTTYNLCRINMFLHGIKYDKFSIQNGDTLLNPAFRGEKFDAIVSNPPYSIKWSGDNNVNLASDERFTVAGALAPKSKADLAFVMHALSYLDKKGTAAIVIFPGVLYRGGAEKTIRQYLVDNNYVDAIIQLPANLFYGTSIATCIIVLKKDKKDHNVLFINASDEFIKVTNNNKLTQVNINKILEAFKERKDILHFASLVSNNEIKNQDYNLSVTSYVQPEDKREKIDIKQLNLELNQIVKKTDQLRAQIDEIIKEIDHD